MNNNTIINDLQRLFADILDVSDLQLTPETTASDVDGWDSLAHINLVTAVEKRYNVKFALGELEGLRNVGDMAALILTKLPQ